MSFIFCENDNHVRAHNRTTGGGENAFHCWSFMYRVLLQNSLTTYKRTELLLNKRKEHEASFIMMLETDRVNKVVTF